MKENKVKTSVMSDFLYKRYNIINEMSFDLIRTLKCINSLRTHIHVNSHSIKF